MTSQSYAPSIAESTAPSIAESTASYSTLRPLIRRDNDDDNNNSKKSNKDTGNKKSSSSSGSGSGWRSLFRPPATKAYDKVVGNGDHEKAKAIVAEREAEAKAAGVAGPSALVTAAAYAKYGAAVGHFD
jgi:hypothetical protein